MILLVFLQFVVAPTGCIVNAMDLKIFPNIIVLLKVDRFKGFSNRTNVNELVINSMSGCNYNKLTVHYLKTRRSSIII